MTYEDSLFWTTQDLAQRFANQSYFIDSLPFVLGGDAVADALAAAAAAGSNATIALPIGVGSSETVRLSERGVAAAAAGTLLVEALRTAVKDCQVLAAEL